MSQSLHGCKGETAYQGGAPLVLFSVAAMERLAGWNVLARANRISSWMLSSGAMADV